MRSSRAPTSERRCSAPATEPREVVTRRLGSLMDAAPSGRLFGAIATLSDMSAKATRALEDGGLAMQAGDDHKATLQLARALVQMDDLAATATGAAAEAPPAFLRKAR